MSDCGKDFTFSIYSSLLSQLLVAVSFTGIQVDAAIPIPVYAKQRKSLEVIMFHVLVMKPVTLQIHAVMI